MLNFEWKEIIHPAAMLVVTAVYVSWDCSLACDSEPTRLRDQTKARSELVWRHDPGKIEGWNKIELTMGHPVEVLRED